MSSIVIFSILMLLLCQGNSKLQADLEAVSSDAEVESHSMLRLFMNAITSMFRSSASAEHVCIQQVVTIHIGYYSNNGMPPLWDKLESELQVRKLKDYDCAMGVNKLKDYVLWGYITTIIIIACFDESFHLHNNYYYDCAKL